jgi:hypothetical protein
MINKLLKSSFRLNTVRSVRMDVTRRYRDPNNYHQKVSLEHLNVFLRLKNLYVFRVPQESLRVVGSIYLCPVGFIQPQNPYESVYIVPNNFPLNIHWLN